MTQDKFDKLDDLSMGDTVNIHFPKDNPAEVNGVTIDSPFKTTVQLITEKRLDHQKDHDVDGIVVKKEIHLEPPSHDDVHGEYIITTKRPMAGENSVSPIEARDYFKGRPGNGQYSIHPIGFTNIETTD